MQIGINIKNVHSYLKNKLDELKNDANVNVIYQKDMKSLRNIDVLITTSITLEELESANRLKIIFLPYTGVNHLPLEEINKKNIQIVNSHAHAPIVALKAFSLGLALLGRVVELHEQLKKGKWHGIDGTSTWSSIAHKRCGVIGMGEIGKHLLGYLKPFQIEITTLKRYQGKCTAIENVIYYDSIEKVCQNSDIIFISLPLTKETKNIIDFNILSKMHQQYIVNVGRGALIDEEALYNALKNKTLKGAALDVWYQYPKNGDTYPSKYPFHELDNLILSPHCAGNEKNSRQNVYDEMLDNIKRFINNGKLKHIVDVKNEY